MASFLTTIGLSSSIGQILSNASQQVGILSPYIRLSDRATDRIRSADKAGKELLVVYGKNDLPSDTQEVFSTLDNLTLCYLADPHAKCFFNVHELILSTMNLYAFSEKNNREMGVRIPREEGPLYNDILEEVRSILQSAETQNI
jgi:hypothetical protein